MELLNGPNLEIVLSLNEGYDFGFLNSNFTVQAVLDGNSIETSSYTGDQIVKFNSELVWATTKQNLKMMRTHRVPLKLYFCHDGNDNKAKSQFGYIVLNLKNAQVVPRGEYVTIKDETCKVVGLGIEAKGSHPYVTLSLRIQEEGDAAQSERAAAQKPRTELPFKSCESAINLRVLEVEMCSDGNSTPKENTRESTAAVTKSSLDSLQVQAYHGYVVELQLLDMRWLSTMKDVHFRFHHAKAEVTWSVHEDVREVSPGTVTDLRNLSARFLFLESSSEIDSLLASAPPTVTVCTNRQGRPLVLGKASLVMPGLNKRDIQASAEIRNLMNSEPVGTVTFSAHLSDQGPQSFRQLAIVDGEDLLAERLKDELTLWKEKERARLEAEFNERMKAEIGRLQSEWSEREQCLEKEAADRMEICRNLSEELQKVMEDVREKEKALDKTKTALEGGYRELVKDTKKETSVLRDELLERIKEKDFMIANLQEDNEDLRQKLKNEMKKANNLSKDQVETLLKDMKKLQEELDSANNSKTFYKEQWSRAVRELHRIKSEGYCDIKAQLQLRKDELRQLGLDQPPFTPELSALRDSPRMPSYRSEEDSQTSLTASMEADIRAVTEQVPEN